MPSIVKDACEGRECEWVQHYCWSRDLRLVEPLLRQVADHEITTTRPLAEVVTEVPRLAGA